MTLKYESEILFELMKRDGEDAPSDVLPYESELKEKYLQQIEGAYPKVQDYRSEWLNYNLNNKLPAEFPFETLSNVTNATVDNVVPYTYGSVILKGNTLVNILDYEKNTFDSKTFINDEKIITHESTATYGKIYLPPTRLVSGKKFLIKVDVITNSLNDTFYVNNDWSNESCISETLTIPAGFVGEKIFIVTPEEKDGSKYLLRGETGPQTAGIIKFKVSAMVYHEGMENWDIPFFTGMQSVKMPVLTTSNEDGTNSNILTVNEEVTLRVAGDVQDTLDCLTGEVVERIAEIVLDGTQDMLPDAQGIYIQIDDMKKVDDYRTIISCDKLPVFYQHWDLSYVENGISGYRDEANRYPAQNWIYIKVNNSLDVAEVREWLTQNPITVQYQRATESIKTVALSCINEQGESVTFRPLEGTMHVSTSSQTIPPLLDMSVPVEATTQNLMSFVNIVEEE